VRRRALVASLGIAAAVTGCSGDPVAAPPTAAPRPAAPVAAMPAVAPAASAAAQVAGQQKAAEQAVGQVTGSRVKYDPKNRRDPFQSLEVQAKETASAGTLISSSKLTGIVRGQTTFVLVETPEGVGYIMKPGDTLGDGRLVEIGQDNAVFAVASKPGSTSNRVVLTIPKD
jgi:hypothetical protein